MNSEVHPIKRIVLIQRAGPMAGLRHITGTDAEFPDGLPMWADGINFCDGHVGAAEYVRTTDRAHFYQEIVGEV